MSATTIVPSLVIKEDPKNVSTRQGARVTFNCNATGYKNITYLWQHVDSGELDLARSTGINSSRLTISNVSPDDAGSYVCIASTKDKRAISKKATLNVKGRYSYIYKVEHLIF